MGSCVPFLSKDQADPMRLFQRLGNQGLELGAAYPRVEN